MNSGLPNAGLSVEQSVYAVGSFLIGQGGGAGIAWLASHHISTRRAIFCFAIAGGIASVVPGASLIVPFLSPASIICLWAIGGTGSILILSLWGFFLAKLNHAKATLFPAISVLIDVIIVATAHYLMKQSAIEFMLILLPAASVFIFFIWVTNQWSRNQLICPKNTRPPDWKSLSHSAVAMVANNFLIGFGMYSLFFAGLLPAAGLVFIAIAGAACFKIYDATHNQLFEVRTIIKVIAPAAALELLLLPFLDIELSFAVIACVMFVAMTDEIICWSAVSEYMHVHQLMPFANMAYGRLGDTIGTFLGYGCGFLVLGTTPTETIEYSPVIAIAVIAFIAAQSFFFRDNYVPFTEHRSMDVDLENDTESGHAIPHNTGFWKQRCIDFAHYVGLTPRQEEVLILLAKGYSTGSIEKQLVVSNHTVKAHIYSIYRKADVHTRQELIEHIEQFEPESSSIRPDHKGG